ncbi:hypothetical protein PIB30_051889, partial [Stylosanthes scabra]|nr:hypothetical protein [Stylosanthes scabra]
PRQQHLAVCPPMRCPRPDRSSIHCSALGVVHRNPPLRRRCHHQFVPCPSSSSQHRSSPHHTSPLLATVSSSLLARLLIASGCCHYITARRRLCSLLTLLGCWLLRISLRDAAVVQGLWGINKKQWLVTLIMGSV